jgi:aldehyde dehydrogenase (NAD+)
MAEMNPNTHFVGGRFVKSHSNQRIDVINPASEEVIGSIVDGDASDIGLAVDAASNAFDNTDWSRLSAQDRAQYVLALADVLEQRGDEIATLLTLQNGMPIVKCKQLNSPGLANMYRYFAAVADNLELEEIREYAGGHGLIRHEPVGVAGLIVPWNGPQGLIAWKLGPALIAGCTAVIKPAPETSLDAYLLAEAINEAGIPDGVINIVTGGRDTGASLVAHPKVHKIAFTGSSAVGRQIAGTAANTMKRVTLELGGKSAAILLEDVDLDGFLPFVESACSPNTGQVCRALTRVLAPRSRYEEVVSAVADTMANIRTGDPMHAETVFGPLVAERQRDRVERYIEIGRDEGAKVVVGGGRPRGLSAGYYVEPTVFRDVDNQMRIAREEVFGPVLVIIPFSDEGEAVRIANDSDYGLGGGVFTQNSLHGTEVARRVRTGSIGVNNSRPPMDLPFGGFKHSGLGRELGGNDCVQAYLETKAIYGGTDSNPLSTVWHNA